MKRTLILSVLALTACAPGLLPGASKQDPTPPTLTKAVLFTPGPLDRTLHTIKVYGLAVRLNDPEHCAATVTIPGTLPTEVVCTYNVAVPANSKGFGLEATGVLVVKAEYTNPDGGSYTLFAD